MRLNADDISMQHKQCEAGIDDCVHRASWVVVSALAIAHIAIWLAAPQTEVVEDAAARIDDGQLNARRLIIVHGLLGCGLRHGASFSGI
jgi:hypothetical protein